jgi:hypothetical protein
MADQIGVATAGVEMLGALSEPAEVVAETLKFDDALVKFRRPLADELGNEAAWGFAPVAQGDDLADLTQTEPDRLSGAHETVLAQRIVGVEPVTRSAAFGRSKHADAVVVADRLHRCTRPLGQLPDLHRHNPTLALDSPPQRRVYGHGVAKTITLQHIPGCPHTDVARTRIDEAIRQLALPVPTVVVLEIADAAEAAREGFRGSPTVLIDGVDPFAGSTGPAAYACRVYKTAEGSDGAPSVEQLVDAVARAGS